MGVTSSPLDGIARIGFSPPDGGENSQKSGARAT
jgi:hypothetical protein